MLNKGVAFWLPIGAGIGVVLGMAMDNTGPGWIIGAGFGLILGSMSSADDSEGEDAGDSPLDPEPAPEE
jgi:integral membrane sensor domain MASE1